MARSNSSIVLFDYIPHDISKLISMTAFFTPKMTTIDIELIQLRLSLKVKNFDQSTSKREMHNGRVYCYEIVYAMHVSTI